MFVCLHFSVENQPGVNWNSGLEDIQHKIRERLGETGKTNENILRLVIPQAEVREKSCIPLNQMYAFKSLYQQVAIQDFKVE